MKTVPTFTATIYVGTKERKTGIGLSALACPRVPSRVG